MGAYLVDYESQLSSVVAEERFEQNIYAGRGRTGALLESEVAFYPPPRRRGVARVSRRQARELEAGENERALDRRGAHVGGR